MSTSPQVGLQRRYEPHAIATMPGCMLSAIAFTYIVVAAVVVVAAAAAAARQAVVEL